MNDLAILVLGVLGGFLFIIIAVAVLVAFVQYVIKAVSFFMIGQKAGVPLSWLAFIPVAQDYVPMVLPQRKYELLFIKPKKRIMAFWILLIAQIATSIVSSIQGGINQFSNGITMNINPDEILPGREVFLDVIAIVALILWIFVALVYCILALSVALIKMRMNLDLFRTYGMDGGATAIAVIGIFVPIVPLVAYPFLIGREPEYGYGNYAQEFQEVPYGTDSKEEHFDYN